MDRSPTAETLFDNWKGKWEAKSAGIMSYPGRNPLTQALIDWADLILVMEPIHSQHIKGRFRCNPNKVRILNISDSYLRDDPELIRQLEEKVEPILEAAMRS